MGEGQATWEELQQKLQVGQGGANDRLVVGGDGEMCGRGGCSST